MCHLIHQPFDRCYWKNQKLQSSREQYFSNSVVDLPSTRSDLQSKTQDKCTQKHAGSMTRPLSSTSLSRSKIWIRTFNLQSRNNHLPSKITRIRVADSDTRSIHQRRLAILGGAIVFFTGLFATRRYIRGPSPKLTAFEVPEDVSDRYSKIARSFDNDVAFIESVYGYNWLRSWMIRKATGNVLEVSAGTGRNSGYYDLRSCKSLTFIDQIPEMTDIAQEKFKSLSSVLLVSRISH